LPGARASARPPDTQQLNSNPLIEGAPARFYGLVFNDNGVLRMDAAAIFDGVMP
jgi:hypothetical protein